MSEKDFFGIKNVMGLCWCRKHALHVEYVDVEPPTERAIYYLSVPSSEEYSNSSDEETLDFYPYLIPKNFRCVKPEYAAYSTV